MKNKEKKEVFCKGRMPSGKKCEHPLYISDGMFIFIHNLILNSDLHAQSIICPKCGYEMVWRRHREYVDNPGMVKDRLQSIKYPAFKSKF